MNEAARRLSPPIEATPGRRVLHLAIAIAGWALFVYWWILVFRRVNPAEVRFTLLFIAFSLVGCLLLTGAWVFHNLAIFRRKGPRQCVREVKPDWSKDALGRRVTFSNGEEAARTAPLVVIHVEVEEKIYRAATRAARSRSPRHGAHDAVAGGPAA